MAEGKEPASRSLRDELTATLLRGSKFSVKYLHSRSKKCESLFSPLPNEPAEQTRLTSHLLTVSTDSSKLGSLKDGSDVFVYAVEVLVYSTTRLTTMFVSKADSTGYLERISPSPIRTISTSFLRWLSDRERRRHPRRQQVISLFGRAQGQYLFPGSAENAAKHILDDRQLIKWWVRVLDPLCKESSRLGRRGYITVPGYHGTDLRQFLPRVRDHWAAGHPLRDIAATRRVPEHAPTRCLLPRFPDDPKARFMLDLDDEVGLVEDAGASAVLSPSKRKSGRWKTIHDLDRFWEGMEFRQECSSGRVVGFLWVVIGEGTSNGYSQDSQSTYSQLSTSQNTTSQDSTLRGSQASARTARRKRRKLIGQIVTRPPRIKGSSDNATTAEQFDGDGISVSSEGYDQAMQTLLHLDFANLDVAVKSTSKWAAEVTSLTGLPERFWSLHVEGDAAVVVESATADTTARVNDLGSMIRKKRLQEPEPPVTNVLGAGLIRKKPKVA